MCRKMHSAYSDYWTHLQRLNLDKFRVYVGSHFTSPAMDGIPHSASSAVVHGSFLHDFLRSTIYDYAIVCMQKVIKFWDNVGPVCLPFGQPKADDLGTRAVLTGWGNFDASETSSDKLKVLKDIKIIPCTQNTGVYRSRMCGEHTTDAKNQLSGKADSGGGLCNVLFPPEKSSLGTVHCCCNSVVDLN